MARRPKQEIEEITPKKTITKKKTTKKKVVKKKPTTKATAPKKAIVKKKSTKKKVVEKKTTVKKELKKRKVNYLNNKDLLAQVITSKDQKKMTDRLAHMLQTLCARYAKRGQFAGYTFNEDMQAFAMMMLVRTWDAFNPGKSDNPFAFYTQCIKNSFRQFLNQEKRQRDIRDEMLVDIGLAPSHTYMSEYESQQMADRHHTEDEEDLSSVIRDPLDIMSVEMDNS